MRPRCVKNFAADPVKPPTVKPPTVKPPTVKPPRITDEAPVPSFTFLMVHYSITEWIFAVKQDLRSIAKKNEKFRLLPKIAPSGNCVQFHH